MPSRTPSNLVSRNGIRLAPLTGMSQDTFAITLDRTSGLQFTVDFAQPGIPPLVVDEQPPLGEGAGPNPARLLAAAVGHCLSASALFCLSKSRIPIKGLHTTVEGTMTRDEHGRLRIGGLAVRLEPQVASEDEARMARCLTIFEDFCIVTQSVRKGVDVSVTVEPAVVPVD